jgi:hypothetical protein
MLVAASLTAAFTGVLAALAIVTAIFAIRAFRKQSQEVADQASLLQIQSGQLDAQRQQLADQQALSKHQAGVLELQAQELTESLAERKRDAEQRHRLQASRVFITETRDPGRAAIRDPSVITGYAIGPTVTALVQNSSDQPVYDVELRWHRGTAGWGDPDTEPLGVIVPGTGEMRTRSVDDGAYVEMCGAVVRFTDADNVRWLRRSDGALVEQTS